MMSSIRPCAVRDAEAIGDLAAEFQAYLRALGDPVDFDWDAKKYLRDGFGEHAAFEGVVAEVDNRVVGYALYYSGYDTDRGQRLLHLIDLYVSESFRRCGIGDRLMQHIADIGRRRGTELIAWTVFRRNVVAKNFYEKFGGNYENDLHHMWCPIQGK